MDTNKYILERIESGPLYKHMERDYSIFFLSSFASAHSGGNLPKYGNNGLTIALMVYKDLISRYYRLEQDNEILLENVARNIAKNPTIKEEIFKSYSEAGEAMFKFYDRIESSDNFDTHFITELSKTIEKLVTYQVCILHRSDNFVKKFEIAPGVSDEIMAIRKKYESAFGRFETIFELLCQKLLKKLPEVTLIDFKHLTASEIIEVMQMGVAPREIIDERRKLTVISYLPKVEILIGESAQKVYEAIIANEEKYKPAQNGNQELIGKTVYGTGKITGSCQVITDYDKIPTLEEGKILITPSTLPKYNNIYPRAKAIVTNEGSILAHAAILCREFKIPGIIGTKIITNVVKNGNTVELDLDKGIVKIIKD